MTHPDSPRTAASWVLHECDDWLYENNLGFAWQTAWIDAGMPDVPTHARQWIAERIAKSNTLTVKADSSSHSDQPLPVAAPKQVKAHWTDACPTATRTPSSLSLPRAWELRK